MDRTLIHVNSNLLRQPQLFDKLSVVVGNPTARKLGGQIGRLARDLILYAAWNKAPVVRLHVPEFCQMFGHDKSLLLRKATAAQQDEMRACSLPEEYIPAYSIYLGYVLVKMANYSFLWNEHFDKTPADKSVRPHSMVDKIDAPRVRRKRGTYVEFTVSVDIVQQNRRGYQTMWLEDYLALVTAPGGYAWEAARRLYMRVVWKRRWWDWLEKEGRIKKDDRPSHDQYPELVAAAGIEAVSPLRNQASKLMAMLKRVGELPSVCMVPQMLSRKGCYYVTWTRYEVGTVGGPPKNLLYGCEPAGDGWGTDPAPPSTTYTAEPANPVYQDVSWSPRAAALSPAQKVWANCLRTIAGQIEVSQFRTWFEPIEPVELHDNVLTIQVPGVAFYEHLEAGYVDELRQAILRELGENGRLEYSVVIATTNREPVSQDKL